RSARRRGTLVALRGSHWSGRPPRHSMLTRLRSAGATAGGRRSMGSFDGIHHSIWVQSKSCRREGKKTRSAPDPERSENRAEPGVSPSCRARHHLATALYDGRDDQRHGAHDLSDLVGLCSSTPWLLVALEAEPRIPARLEHGKQVADDRGHDRRQLLRLLVTVPAAELREAERAVRGQAPLMAARLAPLRKAERLRAHVVPEMLATSEARPWNVLGNVLERELLEILPEPTVRLTVRL